MIHGGWGVDVAPPLAPHPLVGAHKTSPNMINKNHSVALIVTSQGIDTSNTNPAGKLQLNVLMAAAEFERGIIRERVNAGLKAAKAKRRKAGPPQVVALKDRGGAARKEERPRGQSHSQKTAYAPILGSQNTQER